MMPPGWRGSLANGFCLTHEDVWSSRLGLFSARVAQTFAGEFDPMGVVDETIQDGVGIGGVDDGADLVGWGRHDARHARHQRMECGKRNGCDRIGHFDSLSPHERTRRIDSSWTAGWLREASQWSRAVSDMAKRAK